MATLEALTSMTRRPFLLALVLAGAAAIAVGVLAVTAFEPGGAPAKPAGVANVLRIQPVQSTVPCSGLKLAVDIYLDDLVPRPSAASPGFNQGLRGAQLTLTYDPKVLQVAAPLDVRLNANLSREDPDRDGKALSFVQAPVTIDNFAGKLLLGAVGIGPNLPADLHEEGPDPVAKGEPILLWSIDFLTVGAGTATLGVAGGPIEAKVSDVAGPGKPVEVQTATVTLTGGNCAPTPVQTPAPTSTLTLEPVTATPVVVPSPQQITPTPAAQGGRPDCPQGWNVYRDAGGVFELCYPQGWRAVSAGPDAAIGGAVSLHNFQHGALEDTLSITIAWQSSLARPGLQASQCKSFEQAWAIPVDKIQLQVGGVNATACQGRGSSLNSGEGPLEILIAEPTGGGVIEIFVLRTGPNLSVTSALSHSVLNTLRLRPGQ